MTESLMLVCDICEIRYSPAYMSTKTFRIIESIPSPKGHHLPRYTQSIDVCSPYCIKRYIRKNKGKSSSRGILNDY